MGCAGHVLRVFQVHTCFQEGKESALGSGGTAHTGTFYSLQIYSIPVTVITSSKEKITARRKQHTRL